MRAGIRRLASIVAADFGRDPMDGALYCFVSRDCEKMKLLRFDLNGWCMYYVRLSEGGFKWRHAEGGELLPHIERRQLLWLLEGLPAESLSCDNERWIGNPFLDKFQRARPAFPNSTGLM